MRLLVLLGVAGLAGVLVQQWTDWSLEAALDARLRAPSAASPADSVTPMLPAGRALPAMEEFAVVSERPLFKPDRRPPPVDEMPKEAPVGVTAPPVLQISAIVGVEDAFQARVEPPKGESLRLAVGQEYQGWLVSEIGPDRLVLTLDDRSEIYALRPVPQSAAAQADRKDK